METSPAKSAVTRHLLNGLMPLTSVAATASSSERCLRARDFIIACPNLWIFLLSCMSSKKRLAQLSSEELKKLTILEIAGAAYAEEWPCAPQ